jgi:hypothetical protein
MHVHYSALLFFAALAATSPHPKLRDLAQIEERGTSCVKDDCLKALLLPPIKSAASSFCTAFLQKTATTVLTNTATMEVTATSTLPPVVTTIIEDE